MQRLWVLRSKAAKTVNNVLTVLSVLLRKAVEWGVIDRMPCSIHILLVVKSEASFHGFDSFERLIVAAKSTAGWRTHLIVLLGGEAGLRCGDMVALQWADVDIANRRLGVRHSDWRRSCFGSGGTLGKVWATLGAGGGRS